MSEKRFEFYSDEYLIGVLDTVTGKTFNSLGIVDLLNYKEQIIKEQHDEIINWTKKYVKLKEENEQLKEELQRFKKYVFSQDNILCYKCEHCIKKDIYVVDCEMKGEVDVHGICIWFREVKV